MFTMLSNQLSLLKSQYCEYDNTIKWSARTDVTFHLVELRLWAYVGDNCGGDVCNTLDCNNNNENRIYGSAKGISAVWLFNWSVNVIVLEIRLVMYSLNYYSDIMALFLPPAIMFLTSLRLEPVNWWVIKSNVWNLIIKIELSPRVAWLPNDPASSWPMPATAPRGRHRWEYDAESRSAV